MINWNIENSNLEFLFFSFSLLGYSLWTYVLCTYHANICWNSIFLGHNINGMLLVPKSWWQHIAPLWCLEETTANDLLAHDLRRSADSVLRKRNPGVAPPPRRAPTACQGHDRTPTPSDLELSVDCTHGPPLSPTGACLDCITDPFRSHPNLHPTLRTRLDWGIEWCRTAPSGYDRSLIRGTNSSVAKLRLHLVRSHPTSAEPNSLLLTYELTLNILSYCNSSWLLRLILTIF
jgi:hypothetical protein